MARRLINVSIDVMKITKAKLIVKGAATYLNFTMIETPNAKYGNWMAVEDQTKEEREANKKGTILGNGKNRNWGADSSSSGSKPASTNVSVNDLPI
jgi:hypothetical protein